MGREGPEARGRGREGRKADCGPGKEVTSAACRSLGRTVPILTVSSPLTALSRVRFQYRHRRPRFNFLTSVRDFPLFVFRFPHQRCKQGAQKRPSCLLCVSSRETALR